jgi:hypothetical protein
MYDTHQKTYSPTLKNKQEYFSSIDSYSTISRSSMPPSSLRLGGTISSSSLAQPECLSAEDKQRITEDYQRLKVKLKAIEDELIDHLNELKVICLEEAVSL